MTKLFSTLVLLSILTTTLFAQQPNYAKYGMEASTIPSGINVGTNAPEFSGTDEEGHPVALSELLKKGPVVLIFYRGYWCPVCARYLKQYNDSLQLITGKGATLIAVTTEGGEGVAKTKAKTKAKFHIVSDKDGSIARNYGVNFAVTDAYQNKINTMLHADIAANSAYSKPELPVPATYIINQQGIIVYRQFDPDYKNRASVQQILEHLP